MHWGRYTKDGALRTRHVQFVSFRTEVWTKFSLFVNSDESEFPNNNSNKFKQIRNNETKLQTKFEIELFSNRIPKQNKIDQKIKD